jgi:hypothetical protein
MIMETHKLPISLTVLAFGILISCNLSHAEESHKAKQRDFYALFPKEPPSTTSGHYEYSSGGVPLLGLLIRMPDDATPSDDALVNFRTCSNKTIEVVFKLLKPVARKCQPRKNPGDIFAAETLAPLTKAESEPGNPMIKYQGQLIDLTKVPKTYTYGVENAKPGDWVGYAVTVKDGSKRAIFFSPRRPI